MELQSYWIVGIFWLLYFAIHSILASARAKNLARATSLRLYGYYRVVYSLLALVLLVVFIGYYATITPTYFYSPDHIWLKFIGLALSTYGVIVIKGAFSKYSLKEFFGFKSETESTLVTTGIQGKVRHPLYSGVILLFFGLLFFMPTLENLVSLICVAGYIPVGIHYEEKKLVKHYGDEYLRYKKETPMLIPKVGKS